MNGGHAHGQSRSMKPLVIVIVLTAVIFVVELFGGFWSGSLALLADATHMAVDLGALGFGLFAAWASGLPPDGKRTFGYARVEVLAALANGVGLWIMVGVLLREAYARLHAPMHVRLPGMIVIACVGLVCNAICGAILFRHSKSSINLRSVFWHILSDLLGSVGAITAGLIMWRTGSTIADPLATVVICVAISIASFNLVRDSIHILLEGAPDHLDLETVRAALKGIEGVSEVHDLHLWSLSSGSESMSAHLVVQETTDGRRVLKDGGRMLEERFGIRHATLQIESPDN